MTSARVTWVVEDAKGKRRDGKAIDTANKKSARKVCGREEARYQPILDSAGTTVIKAFRSNSGRKTDAMPSTYPQAFVCRR